MFDLLKEINFDKEISEDPELLLYMKEAAKQAALSQSELLGKIIKPTFDADMKNHLIVVNIPDLSGGKEEKFFTVFESKVLEPKGIGKKNGLISMEPGFILENENKVYNKTLYMIYNTAAEAKKAYQRLNQFKFSKDSIFSCFTVKQFQAVDRISNNYVPPKLISKKEEIQFNLDEKVRDQFIFRAKQQNGQKIILNWFDHIEKTAIPAQQKQIRVNSAVSNVVFSSRGTFAAVCEADGVRVFVGAGLIEKAFYYHKGVINVAFSQNEKYMISFNGNDSYVKSQQNLILWAVEEEIELQSYKADPHQDLLSFQFSMDGNKLAFVGNHEITIYNCATVENLKKSLKQSEDELIAEGNLMKAFNIQRIHWLPDSITLTCICYEFNPLINTNSTSKIYFLNTITKQERKWRAIGQHIKKPEITLSQYNQWIAVSFKKIQKKNQSSTSIYIVDVRKRDVETDVVDIKENVVSISWDKKNSRFGVVYAIASAVKSDHIQYGVSFYQIIIGQKISKICEIAMTPANRLILGQNGVYFALYNISQQSSGKYKFTIGYFGKDQKNKKLATVQIVKKDVEVSYMKYFEMDPSGRFILTGTDKMYQIWSMAGQLIFKDIFTSEIHNMHFRPRYLTKLSLKEQSQLEEREKEIKAKYEGEDEKRINELQSEREKEKEKRRVDFKKYLQAKRDWFAQYKPIRDKIRGFSEEDPAIRSALYEYLEREKL